MCSVLLNIILCIQVKPIQVFLYIDVQEFKPLSISPCLSKPQLQDFPIVQMPVFKEIIASICQGQNCMNIMRVEGRLVTVPAGKMLQQVHTITPD